MFSNKAVNRASGVTGTLEQNGEFPTLSVMNNIGQVGGEDWATGIEIIEQFRPYSKVDSASFEGMKDESTMDGGLLCRLVEAESDAFLNSIKNVLKVKMHWNELTSANRRDEQEWDLCKDDESVDRLFSLITAELVNVGKYLRNNNITLSSEVQCFRDRCESIITRYGSKLTPEFRIPILENAVIGFNITEARTTMRLAVDAFERHWTDLGMSHLHALSTTSVSARHS